MSADGSATPRRLVGRRAVVTGGGSGIGAASAVRLAAEGARVAVLDKRVELAQKVADEISKAGGEALALGADVGIGTELAAAISHEVRNPLARGFVSSQ